MSPFLTKTTKYNWKVNLHLIFRTGFDSNPKYPPNSWYAIYGNGLFSWLARSVCVEKKTRHNKRFSDKKSTLCELKAGGEPTCLITGVRDRREDLPLA